MRRCFSFCTRILMMFMKSRKFTCGEIQSQRLCTIRYCKCVCLCILVYAGMLVCTLCVCVCVCVCVSACICLCFLAYNMCARAGETDRKQVFVGASESLSLTPAPTPP